MYVVLKVCIIYFVGDWSNGMIGVSKTFGGSSILSSPVLETFGSCVFIGFRMFLFYEMIRSNHKSNQIDTI